MNNQEQRFEALVRALSADLYRYAYWLCHNRSVAEDLVQETYMRAWRSFTHLQNEKSAKAWLITILRREHARLYEKYCPEMVNIEDTHLFAEGDTPEQQAEQRMLQKAIAQLELEFREPLLLQLIGGFTTNEIAELLEVNQNTVLTRLYRARNKLKQLLATAPTSAKGKDYG